MRLPKRSGGMSDFGLSTSSNSIHHFQRHRLNVLRSDVRSMGSPPRRGGRVATVGCLCFAKSARRRVRTICFSNATTHLPPIPFALGESPDRIQPPPTHGTPDAIGQGVPGPDERDSTGSEDGSKVPRSERIFRRKALYAFRLR